MAPALWCSTHSNSREHREDRGVLTVRLRSDGRYKSKLYVDGGPSATGTVGHLRMEGREVFRHAIAMITDVVEDAFKATGYTAADVDWFIPHQANKRIIDGSAHKLGIAPGKIVTTVDRHGNTSAASIPLALADARCRPAHQAGRSVVVRSDGRRLHLGCRTGALVAPAGMALGYRRLKELPRSPVDRAPTS